MNDIAAVLYLIRHAHAGNPARWTGADADRPLTDKGRVQSERIGLLLKTAGVTPDAVLSSPKLRAVETARIIAAALGSEVRPDDRLAGPLGLRELRAVIADAGLPGTVIVVGHDPDLSDLASDLVGAPIALRKGAVARVDVVDRQLEPSAGLLRWLVPPDVLGSD